MAHHFARNWSDAVTRPDYHLAALDGLNDAGETRAWEAESILDAIRELYRSTSELVVRMNSATRVGLQVIRPCGGNSAPARGPLSWHSMATVKECWKFGRSAAPLCAK